MLARTALWSEYGPASWRSELPRLGPARVEGHDGLVGDGRPGLLEGGRQVVGEVLGVGCPRDLLHREDVRRILLTGQMGDEIGIALGWPAGDPVLDVVAVDDQEIG